MLKRLEATTWRGSRWKSWFTVLVVVLWQASLNSQAHTQRSASLIASEKSPSAGISYGSNPAAGGMFSHDGVQLYYEVYGTGKPLLLIHGNGGSIRDMTPQIDYFRKHSRVIAMDSRDQGKSGDSRDRITYEKMADDLAALLDYLKSPPANVLGQSDGGIEALLLGIRHPDKVDKIAAMGANLNPEGAYPEALALVRSMINGMSAAEKASLQGTRELRVTKMLLEEPHIEPSSLEAIKAPTLILAGDHDLIRDEHTIEIYHHIPNGQLCIFPNATHFVSHDDPELFNSTVERFFDTPFAKKDRVRDALKSLEKARAAHD